MNRTFVSIFASILFLAGTSAFASETGNFTGEYANKKFLKGKAVFQMSLEQKGNDVSVWFSAVQNDGQGPAPEADGIGKISSKGIVQFRFEDNLKNAGTGTITRAGDELVVSLKTSRVGDPRCMKFYEENIRLKRAAKK